MNKICAVYKITNTITGDFYIGSSKDVKRRWTAHKAPSRWNEHPNCPMYIDMKEHGVDKFAFEILAEVEVEKLKEVEQQFIETLKPTYNSCNAKGVDIERQKETKRKYQKEYDKSDKRKKYRKEYKKSNKYKKYCKEYEKTDKRKKARKEYQNQLCCYNGETLTLNALTHRFSRAGIDHPTLEAKKYLIQR